MPADLEYDYRIESRSTVRYFADMKWDDELILTLGDPNEPYGCYARVHQRRR